MSASWNEEKGEITLNDSVDISIAVATEKVFPLLSYFMKFSIKNSLSQAMSYVQGLMTPIIRNADQKTISAISAEVTFLDLSFVLT